MLHEIIIYIVLFLFGFTILRTIDRDNIPFNIVVAIPIGFSLWFFSFLFVKLFFFIDFSTSEKTIFSLILFLLINIFAFVISLKKNIINWKEIYYLLVAITVIILVAVISALTKPALLTNDSFANLTLERDVITSLNSGNPLFGVAVQNLGQIVGYNFLFGHASIFFSISLSIFIGLSIYSTTDQNKPSTIFFWFCVVFPSIFFLSTYIIIINIFYLNNHIITAIYFLIPIFSLYKYLIFKNEKYFFLINFSLFILIFLRIEGALFSALFIFHFLRHKDIPLNVGKKIAGLHLLLTTPWLLFTIYNAWGTNSFINEYLITGILLVTFLVYFSFVLKERRTSIGKLIWKISPITIFVSFLFLLILFFVIKPSHMKECAEALLSNLFCKYNNNGGWGTFWFTIAPIAICFVVKVKIWKSENFNDLLFSFFINAFFLTFLLSFFRSPLRVGLFDSANRVLIHFTPILLVWLFNKFFTFYEIKDKS